jgi:hypothetical protein
MSAPAVMFPASSGERVTVLRYDASSCAGYGLADIACRVRGCHFTLAMSVHNALIYVQLGPSEGCAALFEPSQSKKICGRCKAPRYCSRECQASHWSQHKGECRAPFVPPPLPEALAGRAWHILLDTSQDTV